MAGARGDRSPAPAAVFPTPRPLWEEMVTDVIANLAAGHGLPSDLWEVCQSSGGFPCDPLGGDQSIFSAALGSPPPTDNAVMGTDILLIVVEWLNDNRDLPCITISTTEFMTPLASWEKREESIPLSDLNLEPARVLLFLSG